jgi:Na+-translocating ferredoxin:NAD+ oxidoreductase RnfG subunit
MTRTLISMFLVATVCALVLVLTYRTPQIPRDRQVDRAVVAQPSPTPGATADLRITGRGRVKVLGPPRTWSYGHVQVAVTLAGERILDVTVARMGTTNSLSQSRSDAAVTRLRDEVLSHQSAQVDVVSGATYTSHAYLDSVQAALDWAHAAAKRR